MIDRKIYHTVVRELLENPAVALLGPRQVGKTTLALEIGKSRPSVYVDFESPSDLIKLQNPELFFHSHLDKLVILDEVQRFPELFQILRGLIDQARRSGRQAGLYLLLGSASQDLLRQSGESLAGRISYLEMSPLLASEVSTLQQNDLWLRGGFPRSFLSNSDASSLRWRNNFIKTYLERDINQFGSRIPSETLRRFWTMLAHNQGQIFNAANIARGLGVTGATTAKYLDLMVDLLLVRKLSPWHSNAGKRIVKSPKVFIRDSGIAHALLNISNRDELLGHPVVGQSWESFVIENILNTLPSNVSACFYRTVVGAEVDLVLSFPDKTNWAIEVKHSLTPKLQRGYFNTCEDIKPTRTFVVYPKEDRFPIGENIEAIGLRELLSLIHTETNK